MFRTHANALRSKLHIVKILACLLVFSLSWLGSVTMALADASAPTNLKQYEPDSSTTIDVGGIAAGTSIRLPFQFDTDDSTGPKIISTVESSDQSGTTAVVSVTPSGSNRLLVVHIAYDGVESLTSAEFDGQALTQACSSLGGGFTNDIWYLTAPNATTANLTLHFSGGGSPEMAINASTFVNVDQTTPITDSDCTEDPVGGTNPSVSVTATDTQVVFGGLSTYTDSTVLLTSANMISHSVITTGNRYEASASRVGQNGSTTLDWVLSPEWPWSASAVAISPATPYTPVDYELQYEIQEVGTGFTNVATDTAPFTFVGIPQMANTLISGLSVGASYHWQVRACTQDLLTCTTWQSFGGNLESEADFVVAGANSPDPPSTLGPAELVDGSSGTNAQPTFTFDLSDSDIGEQVQYRIQISETSDFSANTIDYTSALAAQGSFSFTVGQAAGSGTYTTGSSGQSLYNGNYYWRVRAIDAAAHTSAYSTASGGLVAFSITGSPNPSFPTTPTAAKQYKSTDEKLLPVGAETTDATEHLFVQMKTATETALAYSNQATATTQSGSSLAVNIASTGTNRLLVVNVAFKGPADVTSITFDGQALTQVCGVAGSIGGGSFNRNQIWYLVAPNVTTNDVNITFGGTNVDINATAAIFTNVDQGTPYSNSNCQQSASQDHHPNMSVTSVAGEVVFGGVSTYTGFINQLTPSPYVDQVSSISTNNIMLRTGYRTAVSTSTNLAWTGERNWPWQLSAISIKPDATQSPLSLIPRVEIQPLGSDFTNTPNYTGAAVSYAGEQVYGLVSTPGRVDETSYHWQAQACTNDLSYCSAWSSYGANAESAIDFRKTTNVAPSDPTRLGDTNVLDGAVASLQPSFEFFISDPNDNEQLQFRYQISDTANFSNIVLDYTSGLADQFTIEGLSELSYYNYGQEAYDGTYNVGAADDTLLPDQVYYWRVMGTDSGGLSSGWSQDFFITDTDAPVVSNVQVTSVTDTTASLTWDTDLYSNSFLGIGPLTGTTANTAATQENPRVLAHTYTVSSLLSCASFTANAKSANSQGTTGQSSAETFTTTGCLGNSSITDQTTEFIDSSVGGSLSLLSGSTGLTVTVPSGAYSGSADWQIHQLVKASVLATTGLPTNGTSIGDFFYDLKDLSTAYAQASLSSPVTVSINYGAADLAGKSAADLKISRWTGTAWSVLDNCSVNTAAQVVTCTTTATGVMSLFAQTTPVAGPNPSSTPAPSPAPTCNAEYIPPAPELFQISRTETTAQLYFVPSTSSITTYQISYGPVLEADTYLYTYTSAETNGTQVATINDLENFKYFFKVRAYTGCASSAWSETLDSNDVVYRITDPIDPIGAPRTPTNPDASPEASSEATLAPFPESSAPPSTDNQPDEGGGIGQVIPAIQGAIQELANFIQEVTPQVTKQSPKILLVVATVAAVNAGTIVAAASVIAQQHFSLQILSQILRALGLLPGKTPQGFVYNTSTNEPVAFSLIHVEGVLAGTGEKVIETIVTDTKGLYPSVQFAPGVYRVQSRNQEYIFPTQFARPPFASLKDFYKGEEFTVDVVGSSEFLIIPVDKETAKGIHQNMVLIFFGLLQKIGKMLVVPFFLLSIVAVLLRPTLVNWAILILYIGTLLWRLRHVIFKSSLRGITTDQSGNPMPNVLIRFISEANFQVVAATVSDQHGKYSVSIPQDTYIYQLTKLGYTENKEQRMVLNEIDTEEHSRKDFSLRPIRKISWEEAVGA